jgi:hypothetical protein
VPAYYIDLFSPDTWREIGETEYSVSGFRANRRRGADRIEPGTLFLCYLTGESRFIGVLETTSRCFFAEEPRIWASDAFPVRFETRLVVKVPEDRGVHLHEVVEQSAHARSWSGYYRGSPTRLPDDDGEYIVRRLHEIASEHPTDEPQPEVVVDPGEPTTRPHVRIQHKLLQLGRDMGYDVWVARNDRGRRHGGQELGELSVERLPVQFNEAVRGTIELIDVLWLTENRIEAAFEIEASTSIYSGLLRMADLLAMQPNTPIPLYIVAPEERRTAVFREIRRPVFAGLRPPLARACSYISFRRLEDELEQLGDRTQYLRADFLASLAETAP